MWMYPYLWATVSTISIVNSKFLRPFVFKLFDKRKNKTKTIRKKLPKLMSDSGIIRFTLLWKGRLFLILSIKPHMHIHGRSKLLKCCEYIVKPY